MFATTGSMFSRFAQSAKSVMEESFLMITEQYLVEFKSNRLNIGSGTGELSLAYAPFTCARHITSLTISAPLGSYICNQD